MEIHRILKFESSSPSFLIKIALFYALITDVEGSVNAKDGKLAYCIMCFLDKFCYLMPIRMCGISLRYHTWL